MIVNNRKSFWVLREIFNRFIVVISAVMLTLAFFLVLPMMQTFTRPPSTDMIVQSIDTAKLDAPEPLPEIEEEQEPESEEEPPQLAEEAQPLDLSQLELALNPGSGGGGAIAGDFAIKLDTVVSKSKDVDALFSVAELDQKPRAIYQPGPTLTKEVRKKMPGKVYIICMVDERGRVQSAKVQTSSDPVFEMPALAAIKNWKYEPGKRNGKAVKFRIRQPFVF